MNQITIKATVIAVLCLFLLGCSRSARHVPSGPTITYTSSPIGAYVVCGGDTLGFTPLTRNVPIYMYHMASKSSGCSAQWLSGAVSDFNTFDPIKFPKDVTVRVVRPAVNRLKIDKEFEFA